MRTYWTAHSLAARGHVVHLVTNAKEAQPPFRIHMRKEDWTRCEADYGEGRVIVHWTDPVDASQLYLPMASAFVSKLSSLAARACSEHHLDVVFSHYLEPYGVAGHLASEMAGLPHAVRMAGSDSGRLWRHDQLEPLYDHVLRSAQTVIATGAVAERVRARGVDAARVAAAGAFRLPGDLFAPFGPVLDFAALRAECEQTAGVGDFFWGGFQPDRPFFGVFGKLGERKGSFALLAALERLKRAGLDIGLVALAHGHPSTEARFRERVTNLDLFDRVLQIPFLPHWRVPEFLRSCLAVCCLEQGFPIIHHTPIIPIEVLLCGKCLVASRELIRKLPDSRRLPDAYGCVEIEDVEDVESLSARLAAIVANPQPVAALGARGYAYARDLQEETDFPDALERILDAAIARRTTRPERAPAASSARKSDAEHPFPFARLAAAALAEARPEYAREAGKGGFDLDDARAVLAALDRGLLRGRPKSASLASAVRVEVAVALARLDRPGPDTGAAIAAKTSPTRWAFDDGDFADLFPRRDRNLRLLAFDCDISEFRHANRLEDLPDRPKRRLSYLAVFAGADPASDPLLVDHDTARILELSDGTRTTRQIIEALNREGRRWRMDSDLGWFETLFVDGLIRFADSAAKRTAG